MSPRRRGWRMRSLASLGKAGWQALGLLGADLGTDVAAGFASLGSAAGRREARARLVRSCAELAGFGASSGAPLRRELRRRLAAFDAVLRTAIELESVPDQDFDPLSRWIGRLEERGSELAPWRFEGLGHEVARRRLRAGARHGLLPRSDWPDPAGPMLHAGLGHAVAAELLETRRSRRPGEPEMTRLLESFFELCSQNSLPDLPLWRDFALEALGFQVAYFHRGALPGVREALDRRGDRQLEYLFWHGVGRTFYFLPIQQLPGRASLRRAIERFARFAPAGAARDCGIAGLVYAFTLVNAEDPGLFERVIELDGDYLGGTPFGAALAAALRVHEILRPQSGAARRVREHRPRGAHLEKLYCDLVGRGWQQGQEISPFMTVLYGSLGLP